MNQEQALHALACKQQLEERCKHIAKLLGTPNDVAVFSTLPTNEIRIGFRRQYEAHPYNPYEWKLPILWATDAEILDAAQMKKEMAERDNLYSLVFDAQEALRKIEDMVADREAIAARLQQDEKRLAELCEKYPQ